MKHVDGFFTGVRGARIYHQSWLPDAEPRAVILISHGLAEHSGRYINVVNHFLPMGYAVYSLDNIGHGKSDGRRVYVREFSDFTEVLGEYLAMIRLWQPDKPLFLLGHSMGALITAVFLLDHQSAFAGAILSGPSAVVPKNVSRSTIAIARILSTLAPTIGVMRLDAEGVSRDPSVVRAYVDDPLVYNGKTTARLAYELVRTMQRVTTEASRMTLPIMILQGGADRLVDPDGARILYDMIGSSDKTLKVYDGLYHEVYNEPEHDQVLSDVEAWLEKHTSSPS
ncbi:MAG: alpha/beta hydrolase [Candidatus Bipolaricaulota bacterium]|nr:alpha/beta hydrolase [Candidatus Bipolaricaulota bacterium]